MINWIFRVLLFLSCGPLWRLGGWGPDLINPNPWPWTGWRDTIIPILCGIVFGFNSKNWIIGILSIITALIIRLGYGENSIFQHVLGLTNVQARTLCGLVYGLIAFLPIAYHTKDWYTYFMFTLLLCLVNYFMVRFEINVWVTELGIGWIFGLAFLLFK